MNLLVLAGGFGTRLQAAVSNVPKALAPIGRVPFLQLQIQNWLDQGVNEFTFLLHHRANQIIDFLQEMQYGLLKGCKVNWITEKRPMDTGGAIALAVKTLDLKGNFLITNADTWLGSGICEMMQSDSTSMAVVKLTDVSRYGQVHFDYDQRITAFVEKNGICTEGWINAGLCLLNAELFKNWDGQPFSLERDLFCTLVQTRRLTAVPIQTDFIDIGVPANYQQFCHWVSAGRPVPLCN
jgi:D-glycero-alpha-D-manno-heptose 1-phosphate guanylyltransferase